MTQSVDIRWQQRFANFEKVLHKLDQAVVRIKKLYFQNGVFDKQRLGPGEDIVVEGLIQRFEYSHELAWKVLKDYARYQGNFEIRGSRDAVRYAFAVDLLEDGEVWMDMIASRNLSSHAYDEATALALFANIIAAYHPAFMQFAERMRGLND